MLFANALPQNNATRKMVAFIFASFVSNSQVISSEDRLWNDLYCVGWGVKLYSIQSNLCELSKSSQRESISGLSVL